MVRGTEEETLNAMPDAEADQLAVWWQLSRAQPGRQDTRAGSDDQTLQTGARETPRADMAVAANCRATAPSKSISLEALRKPRFFSI
jgi:hypothetical protein